MLLTENILNVSSICRFYVHIIFPFDIQQPEVDGLLPLPPPLTDRLTSSEGQNWNRIHRTGSVTQISSLGKKLFPIPVIMFQGGRLKKTELLKASSLVHRCDYPSPLLLRGYTVPWIVVAVCSPHSSPGYCFTSSCLSSNVTQSKWLFPFCSLLLAPLPFLHGPFYDLCSCVCGLVSSLNIHLPRQSVNPLRPETISDFSFGVLSFCTVWHIISHQ